MNGSLRRWVICAAAVLLAASISYIPASAAGKQTFTGEVSDSMCGRKHMEGTPAECTKSCVQHGSKYALIVGEKIYTLDVADKAALATLDKQAGKNVTVTGTANGEAISVSSVAEAK